MDRGGGVFNLQTMPRGSETGIAIHLILDSLPLSNARSWRDPVAIDALVVEQLRSSPLFPWKEAIQEMVRKVVAMPLIAGKSSR